MKIFSLAILSAMLAVAATEMPSGYFYGGMLGFEGSVKAGILRVRNTIGDVYTCAFDAKSYFEFEKQRVTVDQLRVDDPLEVLAYRRIGESSCYILSLKVVPPHKPVRPTRSVEAAPPKQVVRPAAVRHGNLSFSGVVTQVTSSSIRLRTRMEEITFLLRNDTRYFGSGLKMDMRDVTVNQRLAVEALRNAEGYLEAVQLTWGELTVP